MGGCSIAMVKYQRVILACWIHCACGNTWSINIGWLCAIFYGCFGKCTEIQSPWYWTPALHGPKYVISSLAKLCFQRAHLVLEKSITDHSYCNLYWWLLYHLVCEDNLTHLIGLHHFSISQNKCITPTWACPSFHFMLLKYSYHPCSVALSDPYLCGHCLNMFKCPSLPIAQRNTNCHCIRPKSKQMWTEYRIFLIIAQSSLNTTQHTLW